MKTPPFSKQSKSKTAVEDRDPFIQQDERSTQIPPEMIQQRAFQLYEQRIADGKHPDNLADWLEAERQLRKETVKKTW